MNYEWLTPANVLWRVTFLIAGSKNLRAWTLVTTTYSRLFFREQHSLRPRLLTAMQYPTRPWALFIQKKIWNYHRSTGRKERVLYASIWGALYHQACWVHFVVFRNGGRFEHFRGRRTIQFSKPVLPRPFSPQLTVFEGKTRVGCTLRHPFLFTFAYIKYIIVIKSSQLLSQIKFTPKYIFLYSWLILQSCTVWHQILAPLTNENTNPF